MRREGLPGQDPPVGAWPAPEKFTAGGQGHLGSGSSREWVPLGGAAQGGLPEGGEAQKGPWGWRTRPGAGGGGEGTEKRAGLQGAGTALPLGPFTKGESGRLRGWGGAGAGAPSAWDSPLRSSPGAGTEATSVTQQGPREAVNCTRPTKPQPWSPSPILCVKSGAPGRRAGASSGGAPGNEVALILPGAARGLSAGAMFELQVESRTSGNGQHSNP